MLPLEYKIVNIDQGSSNGTSLQGYVEANYWDLVDKLGEPHYNQPSGDGKVNTEWELRFHVQFEEDGEIEDEYVEVTIYDWKEPNADVARTTPNYQWHVGGNDRDAVELVQKALGKI